MTRLTDEFVIDPSEFPAMLKVMSRRPRILVALLGTIVVVAACSGGAAPAGSASPDLGSPPVPASPDPVAPSTPEESPAPPSGSSPPTEPSGPPPVTLTQAWATAELTDVATGEKFRIADLAGKVVFVETMAIWCSSCRRQQSDAQKAIEELDDPNVAYLVLDVEPSEPADDLAAYEKKNGWDAFTYAVSSREVSRALAEEFGDLFLNPPATPIAVIGTDGTVTLTDYGHKSTSELVELARARGA